MTDWFDALLALLVALLLAFITLATITIIVAFTVGLGILAWLLAGLLTTDTLLRLGAAVGIYAVLASAGVSVSMGRRA